MDFIKRNGKRIAYDGLGYLLILISPLVGWIPGPGGIAVFLAGLGLLAVHNTWADGIKRYTLKNGGKVMHLIFPKNSTVEWTYDLLAVALLGTASYLIWSHANVWHISWGISAFFMAVFIASMNSDRIGTRKKQKNQEVLDKIHDNIQKRKH